MNIAAAYIRVSTDDQVELSPDSQIKLIRDYARTHDYIVPDEFIFRDDGISGRTAKKRPGFNAMIGNAKLKPKPFDAILVWKFSRFARNREDSIVYKSMLRKLGIEVISITENTGDDKMSVLIEAMIEAMDEYYSINLAEEVKRGMMEKLSRGKCVNSAPLGYTFRNGELEIVEEQAEIVKRIFNDFTAGKPMQKIARELNEDGFRTLYGNEYENRTVEYILRNPLYIGKLRYTPGGGGSRAHYRQTSEMIVDGTHSPIIDAEVWNKTQQRLKDIKDKYPAHSRPVASKQDFMLRGILKCSNCGGTLINSKNGYQCYRYQHGKCNVSHYITKSIIDNTVEEALRELTVGDIMIILPRRSEAQKPDSDATEAAIRRERIKLTRVKEAYENGIDTLDEYKTNKLRIQTTINKLVEKQTQSQPKAVDPKLLILKHRDAFLNLLDDPESTQTQLNQSLREFVERIVFHRSGKIDIFYYV
ncbi:MAG: recombinase family protein [Ruminococcus sp.]|nr:recombinase family protein [Ruminococcus sp.]